ncbi:hypothetical protein NHQ30_001046 [Ciborinia camelliae]|nr:hypothetical protein NHQ30_001046 [Ciborinia camelliae]
MKKKKKKKEYNRHEDKTTKRAYWTPEEGEKIDISSETSHLKHVHDVIRHYIGSIQLLPCSTKLCVIATRVRTSRRRPPHTHSDEATYISPFHGGRTFSQPQGIHAPRTTRSYKTLDTIRYDTYRPPVELMKADDSRVLHIDPPCDAFHGRKFVHETSTVPTSRQKPALHGTEERERDIIAAFPYDIADIGPAIHDPINDRASGESRADPIRSDRTVDETMRSMYEKRLDYDCFEATTALREISRYRNPSHVMSCRHLSAFQPKPNQTTGKVILHAAFHLQRRYNDRHEGGRGCRSEEGTHCH